MKYNSETKRATGIETVWVCTPN